jgi:hypothetical protein
MVLARYSLIPSNPEHSKFLDLSRLGLMAIAVCMLCAIAMFVILVLGEQNTARLPAHISSQPTATARAKAETGKANSQPAAGTTAAKNAISDSRTADTRRFLQFSLTRSNRFRRLGPVGVQVQKIDSKRGYYDVALLVKGHRLNRRHVKVNEPVLITVNNSEPPSELLVNDIGKDRISGYVSAPRSVTR